MENNMQNLGDIVNYFADHPKEWSYYDDPKEKPSRELLGDMDEAVKFIEGYFAHGGKDGAIQGIPCDWSRKIGENRVIHIVSTFFLGLKIAKAFQVDVEKKDSGVSFLYYWFLACLYHDIGYIYEKEPTCEQLGKLSADGLQAIREICDIKYMRKSEFSGYGRELVDIYLKGRATGLDGQQGVIDHGIAGGLMLYDRLRKNFENVWKENKGQNVSRKEFLDKEKHLRFSNEHYEDYAHAANAIIFHNIFVETLKSYCQKIDKYSLMRKRFSRVSVNKNDLCFVLAIADTIEPLKRDKDYIDKVSFKFDKNSIIIRTDDENVFEDVYGRIKDLGKWVCVKVFVNKSDNSVTIRKSENGR